jgi:hypothetical protein
MDCAGKVVLMVLAVALPEGGVTVTLAGPTIWLRFALLYRYACAEVVDVERAFTESVAVRSP